MDMLKAAYPTFRVPEATEKLYVSQFVPLEYELAEECVLGVIRSSRFWPELAKVMEPYDEVMAVRRKQAKAEEEREQREPPAEVSPGERARLAARMREDVARMMAGIGRSMELEPMVRDHNGHVVDGDIPF